MGTIVVSVRWDTCEHELGIQWDKKQQFHGDVIHGIDGEIQPTTTGCQWECHEIINNDIYNIYNQQFGVWAFANIIEY